MIIRILGAGCDKCDKAYKNAVKAIEESDFKGEVEKVEDLVTMMQYGILTTPGIVVNEKVLMTGRVPSVKEFKEIISE